MWILVQGHNWAILSENEQGVAITIKGDRYRAMLNEFLFIKFEEEDISNIWFQQNGAICPKGDGLRPVFKNHTISL